MPTPGQEARPLIYPLPHRLLPPAFSQSTPLYLPPSSATSQSGQSPPPPPPLLPPSRTSYSPRGRERAYHSPARCLQPVGQPLSLISYSLKPKARDFHSQILQSRPPPLSLMREFWATSLSEITWQIS